MGDIIDLLDRVDALLRERIKHSQYGSLAERSALKEVRELLQKALTIALDIH